MWSYFPAHRWAIKPGRRGGLSSRSASARGRRSVTGNDIHAQQLSRKVGWLATGVGLILLAEMILLLAFLVPFMVAASAAGATRSAALHFLGMSGAVSRPSAFIILSLVGGAIGGTLHGLASLTAHVADGDFDRRWTMWYLLNPVIGAALAATFLFVLQAGLGGQAASTAAPASLYGIAAFATLAGLFSRNALEKLKQIFDVAFASGGEPGSKKPTVVAPTIGSVTPQAVTAGGAYAQVVIAGDGFTEGSVVEVDGRQVPAATVEARSISVVLPGQLLAQQRVLPLRVRSPGGVWSNFAELEVT